MLLFHLLGLLLMFLFHLLLPCGRSFLLRHSLMFLLLLLLQLRVLLVLLLRQFLLLLLVFLIAIRLSLRRTMLRQLRRMAVRRPVICFRPVVRTWRPVWIVICVIVRRRRPAVFVHRTTLVLRSIRRISTAIPVAAAIRRRIVVAASLRCHYAASAKRRRSCRSRDRRLAMIRRRAQFPIASRRLYVLILSRHRPDVPFPRGGFFLRRCAHVHAPISAIVAHPRNIDVVLHVHVVHIANYSFVDVVHFAVVIKMVVIPSSAIISVSGVAPAVINAAIESHHRPPITHMENICLAAPAPISRRPQVSSLRRQHPGPRHPVIILIV